MTSYIEFNGIKSSDLGLRLYNKFEFVTPKKQIEAIEVEGRNGKIYIDKKSYDDIEKTILFEVSTKDNPKNGSDGSLIFDKALEISKWINTKGFKDFKYSMYPKFIYKAMVIDPYNMADTIRKKGRGALKFIFKPIMYYANQPTKTISTGQNLNNIGSIEAYPRLYITPKQTDLEIRNNGKLWVRLQKLDIGTEIIIDSEMGKVFTNTGNANDKMLRNTPQFPILNVGKNVITFTGATIKIETRYCEVAI